MIKYSREFFKKSFTADNMKSAYLLAVKWFSTNVLSKDEFSDVCVKYEKSMKDDKPTVTLHLFAFLDGEEEIMKKHCECCREMHSSFYINEETNCNRCAAMGFQNRLKLKIDIKKDYYRSNLNRKLEEKGK